MRCPICGSEMRIKGQLSKPENGLPISWKIEGIPFYECDACRTKEGHHFAYQRTCIDEKWYFFNWSKWNFLKEEKFNPSKRENNPYGRKR